MSLLARRAALHAAPKEKHVYVQQGECILCFLRFESFSRVAVRTSDRWLINRMLSLLISVVAAAAVAVAGPLFASGSRDLLGQVGS